MIMDKIDVAEYTLTVEEVANELGVSTGRIRQFVVSGRLVGIMRAGAWFFKPETIKNFERKPRGKPRKLV